MSRTKRGFLKLDALRTAGIREQYAVERDGVRHVVEIFDDRLQGGLVVRHTAGEESKSWAVGDDVSAARKTFRREVRALGGRA